MRKDQKKGDCALCQKKGIPVEHILHDGADIFACDECIKGLYQGGKK